jgi:hypothetical protein
MEPALLDRYLTAAAKIALVAVGDATMPATVERYTAVKGNSNEQTWLWQTDRLGEDFPLGSRGGIAARHYFPVDGEYDLRVRLARTYADIIRGLQAPSDIDIRVDGRAGRPVHDRRPRRDRGESGRRRTAARPRRAEGRPAPGGGHHREGRGRQGGRARTRSDSDLEPRFRVPTFPLFISSLLIGGPYNARVPDDSPSRRRIFSCRPSSPRDEPACATAILSALARRAYRRPATAGDVGTLLEFFDRGRAEGSFDDGVRAAIERLLVSPDFLYRIEADPRQVAAGVAYRLPDVDLASRLSFFLWSSIPDDELLDAAVKGTLRQPGVLDRQVRRMLADPRARARWWTTSSGSGSRPATCGC